MRTFLTANWQNLIMVNYEIDPAILTPYLPKGVELDFYLGKSYVSLVGFMFKKTSIFGVPIPLLGNFEEVNLRFYVVRTVNGVKRRGVVFINETVPNKIVAFVANKLYKEHYVAIPTKHNWVSKNNTKEIEYEWKVKTYWNRMKVVASNDVKAITKNSIEEFIFEHYFGYTKVDQSKSLEYRIRHPSWKIHKVLEFNVTCDFSSFYGEAFSGLNKVAPSSVLLAVGSDVSIDWNRVRF